MGDQVCISQKGKCNTCALTRLENGSNSGLEYKRRKAELEDCSVKALAAINEVKERIASYDEELELVLNVPENAEMNHRTRYLMRGRSTAITSAVTDRLGPT